MTTVAEEKMTVMNSTTVKLLSSKTKNLTVFLEHCEFFYAKQHIVSAYFAESLNQGAYLLFGQDAIECT